MSDADTDWALTFARGYRQENRAAVAFHRLADTVIELRAENKVLRELVASLVSLETTCKATCKAT